METTTTGVRLKSIRKQLQLTQEEFGRKIGVTYGAISKIEKDDAILTEQNIRLIAYTFGINADWLRTGVGEMFQAKAGTEMEGLSLNEREALKICEELSDEDCAVWFNEGRRLLEIEALKKERDALKAAQEQAANEKKFTVIDTVVPSKAASGVVGSL